MLLALELLANTSLLLAEALASHKLSVTVSLCHYFFVGLAPLVVDALLPRLGLSSLNLVDALLREGQGAVSVLGGRVQMQIQAPLSVLVLTDFLYMLMVLLFEIALHDFFVPATGVSQDPQLLVHVSLFFEAPDALSSHAHQHLVGQIDLAAT